MCFQHRAVFTPEVLAVVLNQLVEQAPLPLLLMRTVIQTIAVAPKLKPRVIETLSKLVNKRVSNPTPVPSPSSANSCDCRVWSRSRIQSTPMVELDLLVEGTPPNFGQYTLSYFCRWRAQDYMLQDSDGL